MGINPPPNSPMSLETNPIKPKHYNRGKIDHIESWYRRLPFNEFKSAVRAYAERYLWREKEDEVQDLDKLIYIAERLKEYIEMEGDNVS